MEKYNIWRSGKSELLNELPKKKRLRNCSISRVQERRDKCSLWQKGSCPRNLKLFRCLERRKGMAELRRKKFQHSVNGSGRFRHQLRKRLRQARLPRRGGRRPRGKGRRKNPRGSQRKERIRKGRRRVWS